MLIYKKSFINPKGTGGGGGGGVSTPVRFLEDNF